MKRLFAALLVVGMICLVVPFETASARGRPGGGGGRSRSTARRTDRGKKDGKKAGKVAKERNRRQNMTCLDRDLDDGRS